ncbi:nuclear transport factor 2 family protein [Microtetraspora sp. AC03309]|uniref:nuclear transport factor 2 family protein n=1 Tax=Microtetraspora sp. AC03309 TaxID=2779376 RepID=UPI001E442D14|nr:nuclear transport factor 2 family protein [Microtetraspora sp. AC03309]MCC5578444.1 nuclear transport factor 2 family protein [Microtetraspora sp. AC03309]
MDLTTLEEIRQAKYRYLRCLDLKLWDDFTDAFTEDAVAEYDAPVLRDTLRLVGRDAIVGYMRANLGPGMITSHLVSHPEIEVDGDHATGTWCLEDTVIVTAHRLLIRGSAYYSDTYRRCPDGRWRISGTGHRRTYELTVSFDDLPSLRLTGNRWATPTAT